MSTADVGDWIHEVKAQPGSAAIGMILAHQGFVRGTSRSGKPVRGWVNEGSLAVGGDIMKVLVARDVRDNVSTALQGLVSLI